MSYRNAVWVVVTKILAKLVGEETAGVITHPDGVTEEVALELTHEGVADYPVVILFVNDLTQDTTIRLYVKDGVGTYRLVSSAVYPTDFPTNAEAVPVVLYPTSRDWGITLQSAIAEGADRSIPYVFVRRSFA